MATQRDRHAGQERHQRLRELAAIHEPDHAEHQREPDDRDRRLAQQEGPVADPREAAHQHVLRVAGQRGHAAHVGRGGERDQVRHRRQAELPREIQDDGRHDETYHVVDEERGEHAGRDDDQGQQPDRRVGPPHRHVGHEAEEAREAQVGSHDHHAEEEHQGVGVHRGHGALPRQNAGDHDERATDDGEAGAIHAEERQPAERQAQVGADERDQCDQPLEVQLDHLSSRWRRRRSAGRPRPPVRRSRDRS
jgi:hypothetical protein